MQDKTLNKMQKTKIQLKTAADPASDFGPPDLRQLYSAFIFVIVQYLFSYIFL